MNKDVEVLYKQNKENDLFTLYYLADRDRTTIPMNVAIEYLNYLGTDQMPRRNSRKNSISSVAASVSPDRTINVCLFARLNRKHGQSDTLVRAITGQTQAGPGGLEENGRWNF